MHVGCQQPLVRWFLSMHVQPCMSMIGRSGIVGQLLQPVLAKHDHIMPRHHNSQHNWLLKLLQIIAMVFLRLNMVCICTEVKDCKLLFVNLESTSTHHPFQLIITFSKYPFSPFFMLSSGVSNFSSSVFRFFIIISLENILSLSERSLTNSHVTKIYIMTCLPNKFQILSAQ